MLLRLTLCLVFSIYNNYTDYRSYRVRNVSVVPFLALGVILGGLIGGWSGIGDALLGMAVMLLPLFPLFALRMLGAGDVKALVAIGAMLGWHGAIYALLYSMLGAGCVALITAIIHRSSGTRANTLCAYLKSCFLTRKILPYQTGMTGRFRFTYGITLGILLLLVQTVAM